MTRSARLAFRLLATALLGGAILISFTAIGSMIDALQWYNTYQRCECGFAADGLLSELGTIFVQGIVVTGLVFVVYMIHREVNEYDES